MLKELIELKTSLNTEQESVLRNALPEDIAQRFFSVNDEKDATVFVKDLHKYLASRPMKAFGLYQKLSPEQRALISDLVFDDDD